MSEHLVRDVFFQADVLQYVDSGRDPDSTASKRARSEAVAGR